jgi:hypothetical protein
VWIKIIHREFLGHFSVNILLQSLLFLILQIKLMTRAAKHSNPCKRTHFFILISQNSLPLQVILAWILSIQRLPFKLLYLVEEDKISHFPQ